MDCNPLAPLSMGFPRKDTGVGCISFSSGSSYPRIEPVSPAWQVDSLPLSHLEALLENNLERFEVLKSKSLRKLSEW